MNIRKIVPFIICVVILLIAAAIVYYIFSTEPIAQSEGTMKRTAMLVSIDTVFEGDFIPEFVSTGTIQPVEEIQLNSMVEGQVIEKASDFIPGGLVLKGELLLKIDPSDYKIQLELRKSELHQAQSDLLVEQGRQYIAEQDLALVGDDSLSENQKSLVLRKPQLEAVKAQVSFAQASYDQAQLNLDRTLITAPFDAQVITQNVTVGSRVGVSDNLGRLVGVEHYWVNLTLPVGKLKWLSFPVNGNTKGALVTIRNTTSWPPGEVRTGQLYRQIGILDEQTRLARVLIRVDDPLVRQTRHKGQPKLLIGEFVEARIKGEMVSNVVRLNRNYLRNNQTVWIMEDDKLSIRKPTILLMDNNYAYISEGLSDGEFVVTTNVSTVAEGIPLRREADSVSNQTESIQ